MLFVEMILSAALAQLVERRLGKAEVGGSNPLGSSSKKTEILISISVFLFCAGITLAAVIILAQLFLAKLFSLYFFHFIHGIFDRSFVADFIS